MKQHLLRFKTLLIAAGSVLAVGTVIAVAKKMGGETTPQFALFHNLSPGDDPMAVARSYMGPEVVQNESLFYCDFRIPGNPGVVGMLL